jgi:phosphatidylglycerophosphatase A
MVIKESSDELSPPVVDSGVSIPAARSARTLKDYVALAIATCGVGYLPLAPGTWGSMVGLGIHVLWVSFTLQVFDTDLFLAKYSLAVEMDLIWTTFRLLFMFAIVMVGIWAATRVEKLSEKKDASIVVIDEVAGQLITFSILPFAISTDWRILTVGFILFRIFDIWKPYPIRRLEKLETGLGVMADDVLAGVYAAIVLLPVISIYALLGG